MSENVATGGFEFRRWKSGTEYENWVKDTLTELHFNQLGRQEASVLYPVQALQ